MSTSTSEKPAVLLADERDLANAIDVNPLGDAALHDSDRRAGDADDRPGKGAPRLLVNAAIRPEFKRLRRAEGDAVGKTTHWAVVIRPGQRVVVRSRRRIHGLLTPVRSTVAGRRDRGRADQFNGAVF